MIWSPIGQCCFWTVHNTVSDLQVINHTSVLETSWTSRAPAAPAAMRLPWPSSWACWRRTQVWEVPWTSVTCPGLFKSPEEDLHPVLMGYGINPSHSRSNQPWTWQSTHADSFFCWWHYVCFWHSASGSSTHSKISLVHSLILQLCQISDFVTISLSLRTKDFIAPGWDTMLDRSTSYNTHY